LAKTAIIDGDGAYSTIRIADADNGEVTGFTLRNSSVGIHVYGSSNVTGADNILEDSIEMG